MRLCYYTILANLGMQTQSNLFMKQFLIEAQKSEIHF
jgi:hypothetical protein